MEIEMKDTQRKRYVKSIRRGKLINKIEMVRN